jgi:predicted transcriptional regulator of viral defense system
VKIVKGSNNSARIYNAPLSRREVRLLAGWERERRSSVTVAEVRRLVGDASKDVILSLTRKGALQRVKRGVFIVRPFRTLLRPTSTSAVVQAAVVLQSEPYYLGGAWAFTFHRLTEQQQVSLLDAFVTKRRPARQLGAARLIFHPIGATLMKYGTSDATIEGVSVRVSDVERTLLDALDHPDVVGSVARGVELLTQALPRANQRRLVEYAVRGSRTSTCQRLGVLLGRLGTPERQLAALHARVKQTRSLLSLIPGAPRTGHVNRRWSVVENDRELHR